MALSVAFGLAKNLFRTLPFLAALFLLQNCGGSSFNGGSGKKVSADAERGGQDGGGSGNNSGTDVQAKSEESSDPKTADNDRAVGECLKKWGNTPFTDPKKYKVIHAAVSVLGSGTPVSDRSSTAEPELTLIVAGVNVLGKPTYELLNPNGFYCIKVGVNVQANFTIKKHCKANLADDSKVQVDVLSQGTPNANVGVNVLSTVKVEDVGC